MKSYRIIETIRISGDSVWTVVRQGSDAAISAHESLLSAAAAKVRCEKRDANFVAALLRQREEAERELRRLWDARLMDNIPAVTPPEPPKNEDAIARVEVEIARIDSEIAKYTQPD
jgi:hypothetical protein